MIILDTNVISELMLRAPDPRIPAWLALQPALSVFTTAVSLGEVFRGIRILPEGRRRDDLESLADGVFYGDLTGRILPFDAPAGDVFATIAAL